MLWHKWIGELPSLFFIYQAVLFFCSVMSSYFIAQANHSPHEKEASNSLSIKIRETYISPFKDSKQEQIKEHNKCPTSPSRFIPQDRSRDHDTLPPRAVPFRRSTTRNTSRDRPEQPREQSTGGEQPREVSSKLKSLERKVGQFDNQKEKWRTFVTTQEEQIKQLTAELTKAREERQAALSEVTHLKEALLASEKNLLRANENIEALSKSLKECRINQKSLTNLKNLQNQLELLQQKNTKLTEENEQLGKTNKRIKNELHKKDSTSQSQVDNKRDERIRSLELEVKRLKEELQKGSSQREALLESNLHQLERKLYEKENEIKKISIQLNFIDRKKYLSIDEVKTKKDQEIKDLRQRFMKVSRDLKDVKDKMEQSGKKKTPKNLSPHPRKIKSSKLLGTTSESEEVTFELSSQI